MKRIAKQSLKPTKKRKLNTLNSIQSCTGTFSSNQIHIASWNVNGLLKVLKTPALQQFNAKTYDVLCLTETKLMKNEEVKKDSGGTALFTNTEPISVSNGIGHSKHDKAGRCITAEFDSFYVVSTTMPEYEFNSGYRLQEWDIDFRRYIKKLEKSGKAVIWLGNLKLISQDIDMHDPRGAHHTTGCTAEQRASFESTLGSTLVDSFRNLYPDKQQFTSFMNKKALRTYAGSRTDYIIVSKKLMQRVEDSLINLNLNGSLNAPVELVLKNTAEPAQEPSSPLKTPTKPATKPQNLEHGTKTIGVWFRNCLRLHDNEALVSAAKSGGHIVPFFIMSPSVSDPEYIGSNRFYFLLQSLQDLDQQLQEKYGSRLLVFQKYDQWNSKGYCRDVIDRLLCQSIIDDVYYEYDSTPYGKARDSAILQMFNRKYPEGDFKAFQGHTLTNVEQIVSSPDFRNPTTMAMTERLMEEYFGVTKKASMKVLDIPAALDIPPTIPPLPKDIVTTITFNCPGLSILDLSTLDPAAYVNQTFPDDHFVTDNVYFQGGETAALERLRKRVSTQVAYVCKFEKPKTCSTNIGEPSTTGLSPYLALGCLSVRKFWNEIEKAQLKKGPPVTLPPTSLHGQLLFREQFYILAAANRNYDSDKNNRLCKPIAWGQRDDALLQAWTKGQTGFPFIDALMRQMAATGWMHHLGRHAVSCFLTRGQLWQNWTHGRDVFDRLLLDSDWAVNTGNWLWLSGVAPFSMPYFRIYDPTPKDKSSSLNYGDEGHNFVKHWVPELRAFPDKYIAEPWLCPVALQKKCGVIIGQDYPMPIVDKKEARAANLEKFKASLAAIRK